MKSNTLLLCFLSLLSQVQSSLYSRSEDEEHQISPDSVADITRCVTIDPRVMNRKRQLWNLQDDLAKLREEDKKYARIAKNIDDFWTHINSGNLGEAETLRNTFDIYIDYTDPNTVSHVSALLERPNTSFLVLDYLYDYFPEVFHHPHRSNIFQTAQQKYLTHFYNNYSGDLDLMHRLLEACCINPALRLPDDFFTVVDPILALENIAIVRNYGRDKPELLRKCYELPECLLDLARFGNGETVLTDAIKNIGDLYIINRILDRPDGHMLARTTDPSGKFPLELVHESGYLPKIKAKLANKIEGKLKK